jgi:hypothetical protein
MRVGSSAGSLRIADDPTEMREVAVEMFREEEARQKEVADLKQENLTLRNKAERYDEICEKNRKNCGKREV